MSEKTKSKICMGHCPQSDYYRGHYLGRSVWPDFLYQPLAG